MRRESDEAPFLAGARLLGDGLRSNDALLHLDLSGNLLGDAGGLQLLEALAHNGALLHLDLSRNALSDSAKARAQELWERAGRSLDALGGMQLRL
jgi:Ran GTPase-activating protein (RanGAP) involved in mRNA processing and transport